MLWNSHFQIRFLFYCRRHRQELKGPGLFFLAKQLLKHHLGCLTVVLQWLNKDWARQGFLIFPVLHKLLLLQLSHLPISYLLPISVLLVSCTEWQRWRHHCIGPPLSTCCCLLFPKLTIIFFASPSLGPLPLPILKPHRAGTLSITE